MCKDTAGAGRDISPVEEPRGLLQPCLDVPVKPPCLATASLQGRRSGLEAPR